MRSHALIILSALTFGTVPLAEAHITQTFPGTRTESQKQGPCGLTDSPRGPEQVFEPGETITVEWNETVEHPGHYRIAFDIDGEDFPLPNNPDDNFEVTLVDQIADRNVNDADRTYSQEITFPDVECENCTLQLIQIMTTNIPYNSFYFQCSDISLRAGGGGGGDGPDAGAGGGGSDAGGGGGVKPASGGCSAGGVAGMSMALLLLGALLALRKRVSPRTVRVPRN
jgi:MYXO-CTERM domain-containing protein